MYIICQVNVLNALKEPFPRVIYDYVLKSSLVEKLFDSLQDRQLIRNICRAGHTPNYPEVEYGLAQVRVRSRRYYRGLHLVQTILPQLYLDLHFTHSCFYVLSYSSSCFYLLVVSLRQTQFSSSQFCHGFHLLLFR